MKTTLQQYFFLGLYYGLQGICPIPLHAFGATVAENCVFYALGTFLSIVGKM